MMTSNIILQVKKPGSYTIKYIKIISISAAMNSHWKIPGGGLQIQVICTPRALHDLSSGAHVCV